MVFFVVKLSKSIWENMMNKEILKKILAFRNERDWEQFHTPENLAKSISIESAELLEHFQWGDSIDVDEVKKELADVLMYALLMAHAIDADVEEIILDKLKDNAMKYPAEKVKGTSGKHTKVVDWKK